MDKTSLKILYYNYFDGLVKLFSDLYLLEKESGCKWTSQNFLIESIILIEN